MGTVASRMEAINFPLPLFLFSGMKEVIVVRREIVDESLFHIFISQNGRLVPLRKDKVRIV